MRGTIKVLQQTVEEMMRQLEAKGQDFLVVNEKLMQERMKMSDMGEEIQRLKNALAAAQKTPAKK